jgi:predicted nucleic acid-binding protein
MNLVVDASVALKWFFRDRQDEADIEPALTILAGVDTDRYRLWQPPHFLAEVAAVLAREKPDSAHEDLNDLRLMQWEAADDPAIYETALDLSIRPRHHLFDTLYHATALYLPDTTLVTADRVYYDKARGQGRIVYLADLALNP